MNIKKSNELLVGVLERLDDFIDEMPDEYIDTMYEKEAYSVDVKRASAKKYYRRYFETDQVGYFVYKLTEHFKRRSSSD